MVHRGSTGAERTIAGCKWPIVDGIPFLELDVRLTRDGHAVILHDATVGELLRAVGGRAWVTLG